MKKTLISVAAASLMMGTIATADVDFDVSGQAVVYYETNEADDAADNKKLFKKDASKASVGLQLNANADLGNGFGFGSQVSILDTWGLEKNLVSAVPQHAGPAVTPTTDPVWTKLYLTKKIGNTTLKGGRQELPKSLSPLAFTEGWNVFKNTFDAILAVNTDVQDTTIVGAYVSSANSTIGDMASFNDIMGGAYMLTVQNKSVPMTTLTGSLYHVSHISGDVTQEKADAFWLDAKVAGKDMPAGLKVKAQYGSIMPDSTGTTEDTTALGLEVGAKIEQFTVRAAYTSVSDGTLGVRNLGTGVKTPLYTQMIFNQFHIANDADTYLIGGTASFGDAGKLIVNYSGTSIDNKSIYSAYRDKDVSELDVIYKIKAGGVQYLAAYVMNDNDDAKPDNDKVRVWARYAF